MYSQSPSPFYDELSPSYDVFKFRRFRFNLIQFLRLPLDISERDLRQAVSECSANVFEGYLMRAKRATEESGGAVEEIAAESSTVDA